LILPLLLALHHQGVLNATKSVATILSLAAGQGAILKDNHKVTHVNYSATDDKGDPIVIVTTNRGDVTNPHHTVCVQRFCVCIVLLVVGNPVCSPHMRQGLCCGATDSFVDLCCRCFDRSQACSAVAG
jgi:hypothetical protein